MNERIKELAEQAGIAVWGDAVYMYHPHVSDTLDSTVLAKFTELIVRECADIAKGVDGVEGGDYKSGRTWAGIDVLEHFGVKE